jgi:hypothetical protein
MRVYGHETRARVVARLAAGERLKHICRETGMPCPESVTGWMRADPAFAAEVAQARAAGAYRRLAFDEDQARRLLARLAAGERIGEILRAPDMPSPATYYRHWLRGRAPAWFQEARARAATEREAARRRSAGRPYRGFDPAVAERLYVRLWKGGETLRAVLRSDPAFPSLTVLARWRQENPAFDAQMAFLMTGWKRRRGRERGLCTPALTQQIVDHIAEGHSLRSLARLPGMPSARAMSNWVRDRPDFARAVAEACEVRGAMLQDQITERLMAAPPMSGRALRRLTADLSRQETRLRKRPGWKRNAARGGGGGAKGGRG